MCSKKYKKLRSVYIISNLNNIFKKSHFIAFFQPKSLDFENSILTKQLTSELNLQTFVCKNSYLKQNNLLPQSVSSSIPQGSIVILHSFLKSRNFNIVTKIISKTKLVPLFFCVENKYIFLKTLLLLSNTSRADFFIHLINLLDNNNCKFNNIFISSNSNIQALLRI